MLELSEPELALISVGEDNPFGHPSPVSLEALAVHGVDVVRTDQDGEIAIDVGRGDWSVSG
jgi:competence protein ComEC